MPAHLRDLPRCKCGRAATQELRNTANATITVMCDRCAPKALREFVRQSEAGG
jgi:hypothetical protein